MSTARGKTLYQIATAVFLSATLAACADQKFSTAGDGGLSTASAGSTGSTDSGGARGSVLTQGSNEAQGTTSGPGTSGQGIAGQSGPGGLTGTGVAFNAKASFSAPLCQRGTMCLGTFALRSALSGPLSFDWHTDDTIYQQPVPSGQAPYGAPNVDYVPTGGHLTFAAGEVRKDVFIQDISPYSIAIRIGVVMMNCTYAGQAIDCRELFL